MYREDCPCPKTECKRHKQCDDCRAYHGAKGQLPRCERPPGFFARIFGKK